MRNWNEVDLLQVDLAALSAEDRHGLYAEVERRARRERTQGAARRFRLAAPHSVAAETPA